MPVYEYDCLVYKQRPGAAAVPEFCLFHEVDPIVWTKIERSFAIPSPALVTVTLPLLAVPGRLPLFAGWPCGTPLAPGETEAGSAGEQPAEG